MRARRAPLFFRKTVLAAFLSAAGLFMAALYAFSGNMRTTQPAVGSIPVKDTVVIPKDTISAGNKALRLSGNRYLLHGMPYSGVIRAKYPNGRVRWYLPVYQGMQHGTYTSFYADGTLFEQREYRHNLANGRHLGFWKNGKKKFEYYYHDDRREGTIRQWYESGQPYLFTRYVNDQEEGLQQGWRTNGKLFINYVAKDGRKYGLQETMLCYRVKNQQIRKL